ncbi:MAG: 50S ribosomal protein L32 [Clostridiales bacterium]|jgi:large subunit ribosomal protein L32|nr:50S ribosomal protein L32 [Clostridiales bacterium]
MAIAPKRRISKAKRDKRRASAWKLDAPQLESCPKCGSLKRSHRICTSCGYYKGRQVIQVEE